MKKLSTSYLVIFFLTIAMLIGIVVYIIIEFSTAPVVKKEDDIPYETKTSDIKVETSDPYLQDDIVSNSSKYKGEIPQPFDESDIQQIEALLMSLGEGVSVYYEDINSGNKYSYNDEQKYFIASLIKAPYCMYLYDLASRGECSLDEKFIFTKKHIQEGTGKLKDTKWEIDEETQTEIPIEYTMRELIGFAIIDSDNTAMELLRKKYNQVGYTKYAMSLGLNYEKDISYIVDGKITAKDAGVYINAIYNFFETNKYGHELKADMMNTRNAMITSKSPIARKYGWAAESFHDMAIVYSDNPYLLVILTDHDQGRQQDYKLFRDIAALFEKLQAKKYNIVLE